MMEAIQLTQKLISLPSFIDEQNNEAACSQYVFQWLSKNTDLQVWKQPVTSNRFNVIAGNTDAPRLIIMAHLDTVAPKSTKQLRPKLENNRLYGLGTSDMKSTVAAIMMAVKASPSPLPYWLLLYVDEEYDFLGTKAFIKEYIDQISPQLIVGEGSNNQIINGCRGLIEITYDIKGKTAHAARPHLGNNAIQANCYILGELQKWLSTFQQPLETTLNIASINGGLLRLKTQNKLDLGRQGNSIADYCQTIIDIRPGYPKLSAQLIINKVSAFAKKHDVNLADYTIRHDLSSWHTSTNELADVGVKMPKVLADPNDTGYLDIQMLNQAFKCPCIGYGAGLSSQAHQANEYVPIENIIKAEKFFTQLLNSPLKG